MENSTRQPGDVQAAIDAGKMCSDIKIKTINNVPFTAVVEGVKLEKHLDLVDDPAVCPAPKRLRGSTTFEEPDSFCAYVDQFKNPGMRLYGNPDDYCFTAVFNDQAQDAPAWKDHLALLQLKHSPEWLAWMDAAERGLTQIALADFFEEHMDEIAQPDATDLLSGIRAVRVARNTSYESVYREGGDIVFTTTGEQNATTTSTTGKVPAHITLLIAPFRSWHPVSLSVNLTYRFANGELSFHLKPLSTEQHINKVFNDVRNHVAEKLQQPILV